MIAKSQLVRGRYPIVPFAVIYAAGFGLSAISNFVWDPAKFLAVPCLYIGPVGAAIVAVLLLAEGQSRDRLLLWSAFVGGVLTTLFQLWVALFVGDDDNSIGTVAVWVLGWLLMAAGLFARQEEPADQAV